MEKILYIGKIFFCSCIIGAFLMISRSGSWFPFLLFLPKLLRLLNSATVSIHNLFRLNCNRAVSKAQIHEDVWKCNSYYIFPMQFPFLSSFSF